MQKLTVKIITGMSGAGKSHVVNYLEDMGYYCVDNLPPDLFYKFLELIQTSGGKIKKVAFVVDGRGELYFGTVKEALLQITQSPEVDSTVVFLDAANETLVRRFKETRRRHPLFAPGKSLLDCINEERTYLEYLRGMADMIIDTSSFTPNQLHTYVQRTFGEMEDGDLAVSVSSFGYKYGLPMDADLVMDVRFLPNPYYQENMRKLCGKDDLVKDYVLGQSLTQAFLEHFGRLLLFLIPNYIKEGKKNLSIAIGCTGGQHRSVVLTEEIARMLKESGAAVHVTVSHRDCPES